LKILLKQTSFAGTQLPAKLYLSAEVMSHG